MVDYIWGSALIGVSLIFLNPLPPHRVFGGFICLMIGYSFIMKATCVC